MSKKCKKCNGSGRVDDGDVYSMVCLHCKGTGGRKKLKLRIENCARCGEQHDSIKFRRFKHCHGADEYTHWGRCPKTKEPLMLIGVIEGGVT